MNPIRFGVIGTARVVPYAFVAPARETPGVAIAAVASRSLPKAQAFASSHSIRRAFGSYDALLAEPDIDAVYVALPTVLHAEWSRRALEAGKDVLCEKPLAANAALAQQVVLTATRLGRVLLEGMHVRYGRRLHRQREMIASGDLGRPLRIDSCFRAPYIPMAKDDFRLRFELGGGAGLDLGCYAVACLRFLAAEEPQVLSARYKHGAPQVDRWMRAAVQFPSGLIGSVECGFRGFYSPRIGVDVQCERGSIKWTSKGLEYERDGRVTRESLPPDATFQRQIEAFVKSTRGDSSIAVLPEDSVATACVLDAMYQKAGLPLRGTTATI